MPAPAATCAPVISVVLVTPDHYDVIRKTVRALARQTIRDRIELLVGAPSRAQLGLDDDEVAGFAACRIVETGEIRVLTHAKIAAASAATSPIVAFGEDHCYPDAGWAEALVAAYDEGHAAVGPLMRNANPATSLSWAGLFLHYGCCVHPARHADCTQLPWHNTSYRRDLLLGYGPRLPDLLLVEGMLLDDLRARGHTLGFQPAARTDHVNISRFSSWVRHAYWGGRLYGAMRAQAKAWPRWKRACYALASPAIPLLRLARSARRLREIGDASRLLALLPAMIAGLLPHALGEAVGYALGAGDARERYSSYEMKRYLHVVAADRERMSA